MKHAFQVIAALLMLGCARPSEPEQAKPQTAGKPLDPARTAARIATLRVAAATGNQAEAARQMQALQEDMRKSMRLADPARRIDPEAARALAKTIPGVHSVAWIDRENLLAIVDGNESRNERMIDRICLALEPLGDTLGVVVNLKTRNPDSVAERGTTSRNCQLPVGQTALFQKVHPTYDPPPEVMAAFRASQRPPTATQKKAQEAAQRILEASTPQM